MAPFVLPIFPEGSLASSVITTAWLGVFVVAFFNLRFGWVLSGLVVPGYLVPLLIAKPISASVVVAEAVVTYLLVWLFSERMSGGRSWSAVFGRDRFLALVLVSVLVRLSFDGWLLPALGAWLGDRYGLALEARSDLHSFGLIVVALLANQFWKPGLLRGLASAAVTVGVTWILVRWVLIEFTNFRISEVTYLYEGVASSILASPKSYIILIVTAVLASRMNLFYGWEFGGILIPALIALQWYQPVKILASFLEAFVILGAATWLLRSRLFADVTVEGARKLLLFFNLGFAWKLLLGHALLWTGWEIKVTDAFGFGYLLSTLMAMKMHEKGIAVRYSRAVLQVSLVGAVGGTLIGFALRPLRPPDAWLPPPPLAASGPALLARVEGLAETVTRAALVAHLPVAESDLLLATPEALRDFRQGVRLLLEPDAGAAAEGPAAALLERAGFRLSVADGRYLVIAPQGGGRGGTYVIDPARREGISIEIPDPLEAPHLVAAGLALLDRLGGGAFAVAGTSPSQEGRTAVGMQASFGTFFQVFHETLDLHGTLQLRGAGAGGASLRVAGAIPEALDLSALRSVVGEFAVDFGRDPELNLQRSSARTGFAELRVGPAGARGALAALGWLDGPAHVDGVTSIDALILELADDLVARAGSEAYRPPRPEELLHLDRAVLTPLLAAVDAEGGPSEAALSAIDAAARVLDYGLTRHRGPDGIAQVLLLPRSGAGADRRHWGAYAFRPSAGAGPYAVHVPRPRPDVRTLDAGLALHEWLGAGALLVAGAHPRAGQGAEADVLRPGTPPSLYGLVTRALSRRARGGPLLHVLVRGLAAPLEGDREGLDALVALDRSAPDGTAADPLAAALLAELRDMGLAVGLAQGGADRAAYGIGNVPLARRAEAAEGQGAAAVWLSPATRSRFAGRLDDEGEAELFAALGIPTLEAEPLAVLAGSTAANALPDGARALVDDLLRHHDSVALARLRRDFPQLRLARVADPASAQTFLLVSDAGGAPLALANLGAFEPGGTATLRAGAPDPDVVARFVQGRVPWLLIGGE